MRYILTLIIGALIGGALIYYFFVGVPQSAKLPGEPVRAPEAGGSPPGTAVLTLDENFFNTLLGTIFRDLNAPTFKLAAMQGDAASPFAFETYGSRHFRFIKTQETGGGGCQSQIVVTPEGSGVRTGVSLADGQIVAPLAFTGGYNALGQCLNFRGWAKANIALSFKADEQTLYGQINVQSVNLEGISPFLGGIVTQFVQNSINQRVNPLILMRGTQIGLAVPVQAAGGTLRANAKDIRAEIKDGALRLHITYDFGGAKGQPN
ncbi:MAG TPA: hypothetical protein VF666_19185 [Pyrinomonadaceae bacterium]|jgi:hypothetical protein